MPEALKACRRCGAACRIETFDSERVKATIWMCSNHAHFGGNCPDQIAYLSEQDWNARPAALEIARLQDLVAKFQRGGVSTLFAEGNVDG